jgi:hypothetical protein
MLESFRRPRSLCAYIALTRESAERIIWHQMKEINKKFTLNIQFKEASLTAVFPNGSMIKLAGANNLNVSETLRGSPWSLVVFDEAASYREHLEMLVKEIVTPALVDRDGTCVLIGSPSDNFVHYFYKCAHSRAWSKHHWTFLQNPHLPNAKNWLQSYLTDNNLTEDCAYVQREYFGQFVRDNDKAVYKYTSRNAYIGKCPLHEPIYIIGVDLGFVDCNAITVGAFNPKESNVLYCVYQFKKSKQSVTELGEMISDLVVQFAPMAVVADAGGLGKAIVEELNLRFALNIEPANKTEKRAYIDLVNADLQNEKIMICRDLDSPIDATPIEIEMMNLMWKDESRKEEHPGQPNHLVDSFLYLCKYSFAFLEKYNIKEKTGMDKLESDFFDRVVESKQKEEDEWEKFY